MADQAYVEKERTWADNWNNVIRDVFYPDAKLKALMLVPEGTPITEFIQRYMIEDAPPDEVITNEKVRVAYYDTQGQMDKYHKVRRKWKEFEIYVHKDVLHTATSDRLQKRYDLIAGRIKYLLLRNYHVCGLHFEYADEFLLYTRVVGYLRYHLDFGYIVTV
jgi:hypothetical protein